MIPVKAAERKNGALELYSPSIPPSAGPRIKPIPKAAPIRPKFFARSPEADMSAKYAVAVGTVPPAIPAITRPTIKIVNVLEKPKIK